MKECKFGTKISPGYLHDRHWIMNQNDALNNKFMEKNALKIG